jgi:hypothetical protein
VCVVVVIPLGIQQHGMAWHGMACHVLQVCLGAALLLPLAPTPATPLIPAAPAPGAPPFVCRFAASEYLDAAFLTKLMCIGKELHDFLTLPAQDIIIAMGM